MRMGCPLIPPSLTSPFAGGMGAEEVEVTRVVVTPMKLAPLEGGERKRMGFLVRSKSLNSKVGRVILMMGPMPLGSGPIISLITCDSYEDSYLMSLVVLSLTGDASDVFDWTHSVSPGDAQDLSKLLQMLREHYCGSFTFWEQRNMVKNLHQGAREDATDFTIRVGSSVGNLGKNWKGQITEAELIQSLFKWSQRGDLTCSGL